MNVHRRPKRAGFTLVELMIVVSIIGIIATIAIPKFADLIRKSTEGATKGTLGNVRGALSIYYADMDGQYPSDDLSSLTKNGKYIAVIPPASVPPYHGRNTQYLVYICSPNDAGGGSWALCLSLSDAILMGTDMGGDWLYDPAASDTNWGSFAVNCSHTDSKGTNWASY